MYKEKAMLVIDQDLQEEIYMKRHIKPNINPNRCNAYSCTAYMYAAISTKNSPIFATNIKNTADSSVPADMKGGIIILPSGADVEPSEIEKNAQKHNPAGWTTGKFFKGRYTRGNGKEYSEDSLSVEIIGITDNELTETAEELCKAFNLESVLIKSYLERNQIYIVE